MLIADAAPLTRWALQRAFASEGFDTCAVDGTVPLLDRLMHRPEPLIVSASRFGDDDAMPILRRIADARPDVRIIVLGAPDEIEKSPRASPNFLVVEQPFSVADLLRLASAPPAPLERST